MIKKQETQEVIREKIIKIYSLDKRYRRSPYPSVPAEDVQNGTFVTGQHFEPGREGYYLTVEEMRGQKDLTAAKQKAFPYVINPDHTIQIVHGSSFNLTKDAEGGYKYPKDAATFAYIKLQDYVAPTKSEYREGKHYFYIDDHEQNAEKVVSTINKEFMAMKFIMDNTAREKMREIALLLQYYMKGFTVDFKNWTDTMIMEKLLTTAKSNPGEIMLCQTKEAENDLYILKLSNAGIIKHDSDGFYDGKTFLGSTCTQVYSMIKSKENEALASRYATSLSKLTEEEN